MLSSFNFPSLAKGPIYSRVTGKEPGSSRKIGGGLVLVVGRMVNAPAASWM